MILLTGGSGLLGTELQKHIKCDAPSKRLGYNILDPDCWKTPCYDQNNKLVKYSLIVHCAAYTDVLKAEQEKELCYQTNVIGTRNLASLGIPLLYISTEYVFDGEKGNYEESDYPNPRNFYAYTKLLGEYEARRTGGKVIRCLFKPRPFEHPVACTDQFTSGDYVDRIAPEIVTAIKKFNDLPETIHIGFERKSTFELAQGSKPDVKPCLRGDLKVSLPRDISLNCSLWNKLKEQ